MTALIVIGSIVVFIALLLSASLTVYVKIREDISVKVGAYGLRFAVYPSKEKPQKPKKKKKTAQKKPPPKEPREKPTERSFGEMVELALTIIKSIAKPTANMLSHIRITRLKLIMTVCSDDADDTAVNFGRICIGVYNLLGHLDNLLKLRVKKVDIRPDFVSDLAQYDIYFTVKLRLCHIVGGAICMLFKLLINTIIKERSLPPS